MEPSELAAFLYDRSVYVISVPFPSGKLIFFDQFWVN